MITLAVASLAVAGTAPGAARSIIARFAVGGNEAGYDYLTADGPRHRLYVAHGNKVEVLRIPDGTRVGEISGTHGVHGIAIVPELGKGYTSDGKDRTVSVFDLDSLAVRMRLGPTGVKPDAIQYDSHSGYVYVVNGGETGDLTLINPREDKIVRTIAIGGSKLEQIGFDGRGHAFINDEGRSVVHVLDTASMKKTAEWALPRCQEPTGLAVDAGRHRIFSVCGNRRMSVLDSDTGHEVANLPISGDPDGVVYDSNTSQVLVSNWEGWLDVYQESPTGRIVRDRSIRTGPGARTLAQDCETGTVYVPTGTFAAATNGGNPTLVPESFAVLAIRRDAPQARQCGTPP